MGKKFKKAITLKNSYNVTVLFFEMVSAVAIQYSLNEHGKNELSRLGFLKFLHCKNQLVKTTQILGLFYL